MIQLRILNKGSMQDAFNIALFHVPFAKFKTNIKKSNIKIQHKSFKVTIMTYMLVKQAGYKLEGRLPCTMSANSVSSTSEGREGAGAGLGVVWKK